MGGPRLSELLCQFCCSWLDVRTDGSRKCRICGYTVLKGELPNVLTMLELLSGNKLEDQSPEIQANLKKLLEVMNKFRVAYDKAMIVTSGLRSPDHHLDVYKALAKKRGLVFDITKVPMGSQHLKGLAVDISDPDGSLYQYCQDNIPLLESLRLYCEIKDSEKRVHFQLATPRSGNRFFQP